MSERAWKWAGSVGCVILFGAMGTGMDWAGAPRALVVFTFACATIGFACWGLLAWVDARVEAWQTLRWERWIAERREWEEA